MIVPPSPSAVLHSDNVKYGTQLIYCDCALDIPSHDGESKKMAQVCLDLANMCIDDRSVVFKKSYVSASMFLSGVMCLPNAEIPLLYAIFTKKTGDFATSNFWLEFAAKRGSVHAMILLGQFYLNEYNPSEGESSALEMALLWLNRAKRAGSIDSLKLLGDLYRRKADYVSSLHYFSAHFKQTQSIFSASIIADLLSKLGNRSLSMKWHMYSASHGMQSSINAIILDRKEARDMESFCKWFAFASRHDFLKKQPYFFSDELRAQLSQDFSFPDFSRTLNAFSNKSKSIPKPPDSKTFTFESFSLAYDWKALDTASPTQPHKSLPFQIRSPSRDIFLLSSGSPSQILIQIFESSSALIEKRNLLLCSSLLNRLRDLKPKGIVDSRLWRAKLSSNLPEDLVSCGFIALLIEDANFALSIFQKAAKLGNETASLMAGLILFHGIGNIQRNPESGCFYLSRCFQSPIALLHLSVATSDDSWAKQAARALSCPTEPWKMYEWAGDVFFQGVKFPKWVKVAQMWYGVALSKYEENGQETKEIIKKVSQSIAVLPS